jgi:hypothetical protein
LRDTYLQLIVQLLDRRRDFGDADVWRAAHAAAREVVRPHRSLDIAAPDIAAAPSAPP